MKLVPSGISKRTGKPYDAFYSCPNNRECGSKPISYGTSVKGTNFQKVESKDNLLIDEIQTGFREVNERLDKLIEHVVTKL